MDKCHQITCGQAAKCSCHCEKCGQAYCCQAHLDLHLGNAHRDQPIHQYAPISQYG